MLDLPTIPYSQAIFVPNFQYDVVPAPEPTTMTIIIAGALLLLPFKAGAPRMLRKRQMASQLPEPVSSWPASGK